MNDYYIQIGKPTILEDTEERTYEVVISLTASREDRARQVFEMTKPGLIHGEILTLSSKDLYTLEQRHALDAMTPGDEAEAIEIYKV